MAFTNYDLLTFSGTKQIRVPTSGAQVIFKGLQVTDAASAANDVTNKSYVDTAITNNSGANTTLSNLTSPTSINQNILPDTNYTRNIGSATRFFNYAYIDVLTDTNGNASMQPSYRLLAGPTGGATLIWDDSGITLPFDNFHPARYITFDTNGLNASRYRLSAPSGAGHFKLPLGYGTDGQVLQTDGTGITSWTTASASGANAALSNLASTAVNTDILPAGNNLQKLGSSSKSWSEVHAYGGVYSSSLVSNAGSRMIDLDNGYMVYGSDPVTQWDPTSFIIRANNSDVQRSLKFGQNHYNASFAEIKGSELASSDTLFKLPPDNGTNGYYLKTDGTGVTSWSAVSGGANTTLSNLTSPTSINQDLIPSASGTKNIGSQTLLFNNIYNNQFVDSSGFVVMSAENRYLGSSNGATLDWSTGNILIQPTSNTSDRRYLGLYSNHVGFNFYYAKIYGGATATADTKFELPSNNGTSGQVLQTDGTGITSWTTASASGANAALSNLASTAVNADILPNSDSTRQLGSQTARWSFIYGNLGLFDGIGPTVPTTSSASIDIINGAFGNAIPGTGGRQTFKWSKEGISLWHDTDVPQRAFRLPLDPYGTNWTSIKSNLSATADTLFQLPATNGTSGQVLQTDGTGVTSWTTPAASGANAALSNLGTTSINSDLLPSVTNTKNLGSSSDIWSNTWSNAVYTDALVGLGGYLMLDLSAKRIHAPNTTVALDFSTNGQVILGVNVGTAARRLVFNGLSAGNTLSFRAPNGIASSADWVLPNGDGSSGQVLQTDGAGILSWSSVVSSSLLGANNGVATLDSGGKVPVSQLPSAVMTFEGTWNASTNSPALADGTGNAGMVYVVSVAGSQDLGSGSQTFAAGDWVVYNASGVWQKSINSNAVASVNGQTGVVSLTTDNVSEGSTNLYFTNARAVSALSSSLSGKASLALDNLASVAINSSLLPASNNAINLGSSTLAYAQAHSVLSYIHASTTDFVIEKAIASTSLAASSTTLISGLSFAHATYKSAIIHYQFSEATTNARRVGTLYVTTDGTTTSISDTNADTATITLDFSAAINGANLEISAVSTSANICAFRAKQSLFLS
jgi:hypothetical protein